MRIAIVTPTARSSAVGAVSASLALQLVVQGHQVEVVATETTVSFPATEQSFPNAPVHYLEDVAEVRLRQADVVIYQIGNHFVNHAGAVYWLHRVPGVVCLHDIYLGHLFVAWAQSNRDEAESIIRRWYGVEVQKRFWGWHRGPNFIEDTVTVAPMTEWICANAIGVVTHSEWGVDRILRSCPGPVWSFPLCYAKLVPETTDIRKASIINDEANIVILTFGYIVSNKRIELVIDAIASSSELRERLSYRVVGPLTPEYLEVLQHRARQRSVQVEFTGEVSEYQLADEISKADVVVALRWPATEAASASVIEALCHGKPTIVTDTGWYAELPDDVVVKMNVAATPMDFSKTLYKLLHNTQQLLNLSASSRRYADDTYSAHKYALHINEYIRHTLPTLVVQEAMRNAVQILASWNVQHATLGPAIKWNIF